MTSVADNLSSHAAMTNNAISVIDCHMHFIDAGRFRYPILPQRSASFEALVGDYSALPRRYLPEDYLADAGELRIGGTVWVEFMSDTPLEELRWAQTLGDEVGHPAGMIACTDFCAPDIDRTIDVYRSFSGSGQCASTSLGIPRASCCASPERRMC
jgi:predicted TIM-barrel fold metal-dependent hydrolase